MREQLATPDIASVPENTIVRGWLYQPFASGARSAATLMAGGERSILKTR
jgi:hypothetical protein